ncbi:GAF domain-containing protein [Haloarculaceae archaeon H-GB2-1]|nr:GAF domain-containing protein [Haloarculaceae archaeon H-GB2-1]
MKPSGPESDDEVSRRLDELERYEAMVETVPDGVYTLDTDLCFSAVNEGLVELTGYDRSELVGAHTSLLFEESVIEDAERRREYLREHPEEALTTQYELITASGEQVPVEVRFTARRSGGEYRGTVGVVRDVTHRLERERELRRQRDELERLDRINAVIRDVVNALAAATSRAEIDQAVCDRLAASEPYEFVWLVEFDDDDETVLRSWAGMEAAYFTDGDAPETFLSVAEDTCARALRTQSVETVQFTGDEATAVERGSPGADRAIAAVPLVNEGVEYGAIMIYAAHENAFDTRETAVLGELGATTSYAIAALEQETHSRTLTALQESTRELMHAESQADIAGAVAETAVSVLEFDGSVLYRFEQETGRLEPAASAGSFSDAHGEYPTVQPGAQDELWTAFVEDETTLLDRSDAATYLSESVAVRRAMAVPVGDHGVLLVGSTEQTVFDENLSTLVELLAGTAEAAFDRVDRETELRRRDRAHQQQNRRLNRLKRLNEIIREVDQGLVQATTRAEIEEVVCEKLTTEGRFAFAWVGTADTNGDAVVPSTWSGTGKGYLDSVSLTVDDGGDEPSVKTSQHGTVTSVPNVATGLRDAPWRAGALSREFQSVISVPIAYEDVSYGVLTVYASEAGLFAEMEQEVLAELGVTVAHAINAVETRQALFSDSVVELDFRIHGDKTAFLPGSRWPYSRTSNSSASSRRPTAAIGSSSS